MKKFILFGICSVALVACDSSTGLKEMCLSNFRQEDIAADKTIQKQCECIEKRMVEQYGTKYTKQTVNFMKAAQDFGPDEAEKRYPDFDGYKGRDRFSEISFGEQGCDKITGYDPDEYDYL